MKTEDIKAFYTRYNDKIFDKRLNSPYKLRRYAHIKQYQSVLSFVEPGMKVLDAGCGDGILSVMMAKKGAIVTGCDISEPNIERCRAYAKEQGLSNIQFQLADSEKLPFADNSFDLVVSSHVLEHLPDFDLGLRELLRVSKKQAVAAIPTVLNKCSLVQVGHGWFYLKGPRSFAALPWGTLKMFWALVTGQEGVNETYGGEGAPHVFRFPWIMKKKIRKNGFILKQYEASSLVIPYFEFLLPVTKFLDQYKDRKFFRNFGYGTTYLIEKPLTIGKVK